jgi:two-component system sensor histidine kinase ChvG
VSSALRRAWDALVHALVRIRTRLLAINLVIVLVPIVGLEWARTFEREMLRALEDDMRNQVQVIRTVLEANPDHDSGVPQFWIVAQALEDAAKRTRTRVRLLDREGELIADSHGRGAPEGPEPKVSGWFYRRTGPPRRHRGPQATDAGPLRNRVEVRAARAGRLGTATRIHHRLKRAYLFVAMPVMVKRRVAGVVYITRSTVPALMGMHRLRRQLGLVLAVALGVTALTSLFLAATISRPLGRLTRAARRIADGDRTASLHLARRDEIGQLARAFDAMVRQLDGRARYIAELAANLSHEFKTPLASIRGAAELLADGAADDPAARARFLGNILADSERLTRLVSRILELSRIEASLEHREPVELVSLVRGVAARFAGQTPAIELAIEADAIRLSANRAHLESALLALLENALRFSPHDQPVVVRAAVERARQVVVSVSDRGPGVSPANQAKIFDRFFTTEAARGGTGLGLAIAATVARAHGGTIGVESEPGRGACFSLRLPLRVDARAGRA